MCNWLVFPWKKRINSRKPTSAIRNLVFLRPTSELGNARTPYSHLDSLDSLDRLVRLDRLFIAYFFNYTRLATYPR